MKKDKASYGSSPLCKFELRYVSLLRFLSGVCVRVAFRCVCACLCLYLCFCVCVCTFVSVFLCVCV